MTRLRALLWATLGMLAAACSTPPAAPPEQAPRPPDLSGNWLLTVQSQFGSEVSRMTLQQDGTRISGTIAGQSGTVPYTGSIDGSAVAFTFTIRSRGMQLRIDQNGTLEGDALIKGESRIGEFAEGTFTAKKQSP